jgi:hypothetical protein
MQNISSSVRTSDAQLQQADSTQHENHAQAQPAPVLRLQSAETPLLQNQENTLKPAHGEQTDTPQGTEAASPELLPLVTEGPSYDFIRSNFPVLYHEIEAWRRLSSADLTPRDVIGMQLTSSQMTLELEKLKKFKQIMELAASTFRGAAVAPDSKPV